MHKQMMYDANHDVELIKEREYAAVLCFQYNSARPSADSNTLIGAGCVVTKDISDNCAVVGNPCHVKRLTVK